MRVRLVKLVLIKTGLAVLALAGLHSVHAADFRDSFDRNSSGWMPVGDAQASIVSEPGTGNKVLELRPVRRKFSHVVFDGAGRRDAFRMTGRFLFPTEGDGYLGLLYGIRPESDRKDFGCVYVKSNGSYIRFSPHYDGNPSWRLYEELRVNLTGEKKIRVGKWYDFMIEVRDSFVSLYIDDMASPLFSTDLIDIASGLVGLEARPGRGEPVWVDDIRIHSLNDEAAPPETKSKRAQANRPIAGWRVYGETLDDDAAADPSRLSASANWSAVRPDKRGAVITARYTRLPLTVGGHYLFGASFDHAGGDSGTVLAISSANHLSVWLNGEHVGEVQPAEYIWSDHVTNPAHKGARLAIRPLKGRNELLIVEDADRFAGGGFFITLDSA